MSWSYSKLALYEKCPYALQLKKEFKVEPNEHMARGITLHKECENFINSGEPPTNIKYFTDDLHTLRSLNAQAEVPWGLNVDWTPTDDFNNAWGKCIIDAVCNHPDNYLLIVDFKTGKPSPLSHQDQAQIYAITANIFYPKIETIKTEFWYLDLNTKKETSFTQQELTRYKTVLETRINRMLNDTTLNPHPSKWNCKWCNYKQHCWYACE